MRTSRSLGWRVVVDALENHGYSRRCRMNRTATVGEKCVSIAYGEWRFRLLAIKEWS